MATSPSTAFSGSDVSAEFGALKTRLDSIERTQERLSAEFEALKTQFTQLETDRGPGFEEYLGFYPRCAWLTFFSSQQRLPARLHNSRATIMKATLKTPVAANGKPAPGFPTSRGEFEHITKERYEALLKAYGQPLKGDTEAKREALRAFAGIPQDGQ
ncbi:hypothetical protein HYDPIDRAFT_115532 [Hydnomerulius pinastri MD-312]|uniref:Uncharacterized protein n=1 Tax=Hydnomerulius pinastri MD-312 TaxID=994086 RepID=A0A0C9W558_9AGAM|nr:hypothetical protein HYDPIDRAFT_115532 [Hydnomerulius pinastri MD-312]